MKGIAEFLNKMRGVQAREAVVRLAIQAALKRQIGLEILLGSISSKGGAVDIKGIDQAARSAMFIKKSAILAEINAAQTIRLITDIR